LIPQAFTQRDVSDAFRWSQTLPADVRDGIKSVEQMVWLFLRTKRLGGGIPTREDMNSYNQGHGSSGQVEESKSSQEFQKTLKSLRQELDQFDPAVPGHVDFAREGTGRTVRPPMDSQGGSVTKSVQPTKQLELEAQNQAGHSFSQDSGSANTGSQTYNTSPHAPNLLTSLRLDPKSRQIVGEIREGLNLSSDMEVIRMSLVLAHKRVKDLL